MRTYVDATISVHMHEDPLPDSTDTTTCIKITAPGTYICTYILQQHYKDRPFLRQSDIFRFKIMVYIPFVVSGVHFAPAVVGWI
jgi:hypothetical protein